MVFAKIQMNKTDAADRLGFLLSEANLSRIDATQLNDVFQKRPDIFMQLSKTKKASLFKRVCRCNIIYISLNCLS